MELTSLLKDIVLINVHSLRQSVGVDRAGLTFLRAPRLDMTMGPYKAAITAINVKLLHRT